MRNRWEINSTRHVSDISTVDSLLFGVVFTWCFISYAMVSIHLKAKCGRVFIALLPNGNRIGVEKQTDHNFFLSFSFSYHPYCCCCSRIVIFLYSDTIYSQPITPGETRALIVKRNCVFGVSPRPNRIDTNKTTHIIIHFQFWGIFPFFFIPYV